MIQKWVGKQEASRERGLLVFRGIYRNNRGARPPGPQDNGRSRQVPASALACSIPGREGEKGWGVGGTGFPGTGQLVSVGSSTHAPVALSLPPWPLPRQEHLSSTLSALRSNQIITLKVCGFWKVSGPLSAERVPVRRAQHCTSPGPTVGGGGALGAAVPLKAAGT